MSYLYNWIKWHEMKYLMEWLWCDSRCRCCAGWTDASSVRCRCRWTDIWNKDIPINTIHRLMKPLNCLAIINRTIPEWSLDNNRSPRNIILRFEIKSVTLITDILFKRVCVKSVFLKRVVEVLRRDFWLRRDFTKTKQTKPMLGFTRARIITCMNSYSSYS